MKMRKLAALLLAGCLIIGNAGLVMATETENGTSKQNQEVVSGEQDETETPGENSEDLSNVTEETDKETEGQQTDEVDKETEGQQTDEVDKETDKQQDVEKDTAGKNGISVQSKTGVETQTVGENSLDVVYVSETGSDENGDGSQEAPVASLATAVLAVKDGGTIHVMTDIEANRLALVSHKKITIDGGGHTVTRGDDFTATNDLGRGGYNPAMIEVANGSELTLVDITLDDEFRTEGTEFEIAGDSHADNSKKVHDGIIASYGDGHATIVLGEGTTLKNFGGLSAVFITGENGAGATLIMKSGSKICDDATDSRQGGYAAIYNHGGTVEAETGSSIESIDGRAIYGDNGGVTTFGGNISNITSNEVMKAAINVGNGGNGFGGVAYYGDGHTQFTLGEGGAITDIKSHDGQSSDVMLHLISCTFKTAAGSEIDGIQTVGLADMNGATVDIAGSVHDCDTRTVLFRMRGTQGAFYLRESGTITNNKTSDVALIYLNGGKPTIEIAGTIDNMNKPALFISNNGSRKDGTVKLTETGVITNITGNAIIANDPSAVMIQGTISNCSGYAVNYDPKSTESLLSIEDSASIFGNGSGGAQIRVAGSNSATDVYEHAEIASGAIEGNTTIDLKAFDVTLNADYSDIQLGNANAKATTVIEEAVEGEHPDWTVIGSSAVWMQPSEESVHFTASRPYSVKNTGLFAAYVPLNESGEPNGDVELKEVGNEDVIDVTLEGLTPGQSYALMFVNNTEYTLAPDDVTIYTGGGQGDEQYDDGGFPELTLLDSIDLTLDWSFLRNDLSELTVDGQVYEPTEDRTRLSRLTELFEVAYYDADGKQITDDSTSGEYAAKLTLKEGYEPEDIRVNGNEINLDGEGTLIVRHTANTEGATKGEITYDLLETEPTQPVENAVAIATKSSSGREPLFYLNNDTSRSFSNTGGVQLLDDDLLTDFGDGRQELMEEKAAEYLGAPGEGQAYRYDFHYLDLVDAYNGNAWVSAQYGTTVYLPYPEGVTMDNADELGVKVLHYPELHREYGIAGQAEVEEALAACQLEEKKVEFTEAGIKFDVPREGFSPFAVVWQTTAYTITASAGEGGTISPSGSVIVGEGADKSFIMTPNEGYDIAEIKIDGQAVELADIVDEDGIAAYTFENITADHTIEVTFKAEPTTPGGGDEPDDPDVPDEPDVPGGNDKPDKPGSGQDNTGVKDTNAGKDNAGQDRAVKTGDTTDIMLYVMLTGAALCAVAGTLTWRKIRK